MIHYYVSTSEENVDEENVDEGDFDEEDVDGEAPLTLIVIEFGLSQYF